MVCSHEGWDSSLLTHSVTRRPVFSFFLSLSLYSLLLFFSCLLLLFWLLPLPLVQLKSAMVCFLSVNFLLHSQLVPFVIIAVSHQGKQYNVYKKWMGREEEAEAKEEGEKKEKRRGEREEEEERRGEREGSRLTCEERRQRDRQKEVKTAWTNPSIHASSVSMSREVKLPFFKLPTVCFLPVCPHSSITGCQ